MSSELWHATKAPARILQERVTKGVVIYPDDRAETGSELLEIVISLQNYDILEFLLVEWRNILPKQGLSKRAGWMANVVLGKHRVQFTERQLRLLQQVVSFSELEDEAVTSRVHEAARQGIGMEEALKEEGWAKDMLDDTGTSPMHLAAGRGNAGALRHLIDAGASVEILDKEGFTPLLSAAQGDEANCAQLLLGAGCRIDQSDNHGHTALHCAAAFGSAKATGLLLSWGQGTAAVTRVRAMAAATGGLNGDFPLHSLAISVRRSATPEAIETTAKMLLATYPKSLEARNSMGQTPMMTALEQDNLPLARCLSRAGALLSVTDRFSHNILHVAAAYCTKTTLDFLMEVVTGRQIGIHPLGIDHQRRNFQGDTPWDLFVACTHMSPWIASWRRYSATQTRSAFVTLYRCVRDRSLRYEMTILESALNALSNNESNAARDHLFSVSGHKMNGDRASRDSAGWYRAIAKQIEAGERESAAAGIEQGLRDLHDEVEDSPWDQRSHYDYLVNQNQWLELPHGCFWVEPAYAFEQYHDLEPQSGTECVGWNRKLHYDQITQIYSDLGQPLHDCENSLYSVYEFLEQLGLQNSGWEAGL